MNSQILFRTTEENKRAIRILAAQLGYPNVSAYMNALVEQAIENAGWLRDTFPFSESGPQAEQQAAQRRSARS